MIKSSLNNEINPLSEPKAFKTSNNDNIAISAHIQLANEWQYQRISRWTPMLNQTNPNSSSNLMKREILKASLENLADNSCLERKEFFPETMENFMKELQDLKNEPYEILFSLLEELNFLDDEVNNNLFTSIMKYSSEKDFLKVACLKGILFFTQLKLPRAAKEKFEVEFNIFTEACLKKLLQYPKTEIVLYKNHPDALKFLLTSQSIESVELISKEMEGLFEEKTNIFLEDETPIRY